jgi:hypothetical protein
MISSILSISLYVRMLLIALIAIFMKRLLLIRRVLISALNFLLEGAAPLLVGLAVGKHSVCLQQCRYFLRIFVGFSWKHGDCLDV